MEDNKPQDIQYIGDLCYKNLYITALNDLSINDVPRCSKFILARNGYYLYFPTYVGAGVYSNPNYSYFTNYQILPNLSYQLYLLGEIVSFYIDSSNNLTLSINDNINNLQSAGGIIIASDFIFNESADIINSSCINLNNYTNASIKLEYMDNYTSWLGTIKNSDEINGIIYKTGTDYLFSPIVQGYTAIIPVRKLIKIGNHAIVTFKVIATINPTQHALYQPSSYIFNFPVDPLVSLNLIYEESPLLCNSIPGDQFQVSNFTAQAITLDSYTPYQVYIIYS